MASLCAADGGRCTRIYSDSLWITAIYDTVLSYCFASAIHRDDGENRTAKQGKAAFLGCV